ncbi:hypothetical protein [Streptomyces sp. NBC_01264]|uniref:hypothetical protein n=1 Tax=Streptomyces sp. NBC_01264 TaxID=2903804 RepID=UPI0022510A43|nr:hypothetical protein [Streptomyces sp. NBC_01264]MCX4778147.1 hypothetical protein [Streptomyces sp. NBC_01264]
MPSSPLIETPDEYTLALAERETQTDTIDPVTALIEARIQVAEFRHSYLEAA